MKYDVHVSKTKGIKGIKDKFIGEQYFITMEKIGAIYDFLRVNRKKRI
jgi:hypothetical protein